MPATDGSADLSKDQVQVAALGFVLPVSWLKSFEFLSFTSTLGTLSVLAALITVLIDGLGHQGSLDAVTSALSSLPLWPDSFESYFKSLGSVLFLFCVNFLVFPIERSMKNPGNFDRAVNGAVWTTASVNILFAALAFSFYGQETQDIVLNNLGPGNVLTAVKLLLCADLLLTYPLVFAAGREILENAFLNDEEEGEEGNRTEGLPVVSGKKALLRTSLVGFTLLVGNLKGFGLITNIAGGLAQGSLAFIIPPALQLQLKPSTRISQLMASALILLGLLSSGLTTYEAIVSS
ncbi:hypothetical protein GUITHDRAFT_99946 [Guillardia theta CCMP2712]|uniref:Amino acid transporter transmembrane domain-containing protein n=1 Tax=Guillardia theta (strain CCMP2712) TaxID=905079 RepID=L1K1I0_GUITC|nr:hypothetical protein GUITHDRAFT_99946 [Guillardia theta CCMP2712]EKX54467.1 hypothetical protein GUITHDRAFT_99946 [Guillardia theta CCMP2712]|eukprot:XP_005841447.1 hypothetical protein GUITHDRAFT_99946 [Guillardia theta CCMP2712]